MTIWQGNITVKHGTRDQYIKALQEADLVNIFRKHPGNIYYVLGPSITDPDMVEVCDAWETKEDFLRHDTSADVDVWRKIYAEYVVSCKSMIIENGIITSSEDA